MTPGGAFHVSTPESGDSTIILVEITFGKSKFCMTYDTEGVPTPLAESGPPGAGLSDARRRPPGHTVQRGEPRKVSSYHELALRFPFFVCALSVPSVPPGPDRDFKVFSKASF